MVRNSVRKTLVIFSGYIESHNFKFIFLGKQFFETPDGTTTCISCHYIHFRVGGLNGFCHELIVTLINKRSSRLPSKIEVSLEKLADYRKIDIFKISYGFPRVSESKDYRHQVKSVFNFELSVIEISLNMK